jgi:hypothetical protein
MWHSAAQSSVSDVLGGFPTSTGKLPSVQWMRLCSVICDAWKWSFSNIWEKLQCIWKASFSRTGSPHIRYRSVVGQMFWWNLRLSEHWTLLTISLALSQFNTEGNYTHPWHRCNLALWYLPLCWLLPPCTEQLYDYKIYTIYLIWIHTSCLVSYKLQFHKDIVRSKN